MPRRSDSLQGWSQRGIDLEIRGDLMNALVDRRGGPIARRDVVLARAGVRREAEPPYVDVSGGVVRLEVEAGLSRVCAVGPWMQRLRMSETRGQGEARLEGQAVEARTLIRYSSTSSGGVWSRSSRNHSWWQQRRPPW